MSIAKLSLRGGYVNRRTFHANLKARATGGRHLRPPAYMPAEVTFQTDAGTQSIIVRDYDIPILRHTNSSAARDHLELILKAREGNGEARAALEEHARQTLERIEPKFQTTGLVEDPYVIASTTEEHPPAEVVSHKGSILLRLIQKGYPVPDFSFLTARAYKLEDALRKAKVRDAIHNLEILTGQQFGGEEDPLLVAVRTAMPAYIPGVMPTYLNIGVTEGNFPALVKEYGEEAAYRILLSNLCGLLSELDPDEHEAMIQHIRPTLSLGANKGLCRRLTDKIRARDARLFQDAYYQALFLTLKAYEDYERNLDFLRNYMRRDDHHPTVIFQKMVCSVVGNESYAGVLFSQHPNPRTPMAEREVRFARGVFGDELMTGRTVSPTVVNYPTRADVEGVLPAVYAFDPAIPDLEQEFTAPLMLEFAAAGGIFALLQLNLAELTGKGTLIAVMGLFRQGIIDAQRVVELIKPYHLKQLEERAITDRSLAKLTQFCRGQSVLPRIAVTGKIYFSTAAAQAAKQAGETVILAKESFKPTDAVIMGEVDGIVSIEPAAIHVVTTAQNTGIPALLNLQHQGTFIGEDAGGRYMQSGREDRLVEGEEVTISSYWATLYRGQAEFRPARLLRFIAGETVEMRPEEREIFERLAEDYRAYKQLVESAQADEIDSFHALFRLVSMDLKDKDDEARALVNAWYENHKTEYLEALFASSMGDHKKQATVFDLLSLENQIELIKAGLQRNAQEGKQGLEFGSFVLGWFVGDRFPPTFWQSLEPGEIAMLINEWILHQKYLNVLHMVGERRTRRAREHILAKGLGELALHTGALGPLVKLKLSKPDWDAIERAIPAESDPQIREAMALLRLPFSEHYTKWTWSILVSRCEREGIPVPEPEDI